MASFKLLMAEQRAGTPEYLTAQRSWWDRAPAATGRGGDNNNPDN